MIITDPLSPDPTTDARGAHSWTVAVGSGVKLAGAGSVISSSGFLTKQQVTRRRFPVRLELYDESAKPQA
jgi:hypothetical protein